MDIRELFLNFLIQAPTFLFALTFHELAHGYVAWKLGDPTAKDAGRLTMNPLKHLDPWGAAAFVIMNIGWAKPVPVNPAYFRQPRKGMLLVALAGPGANLLLATASAVLFKLIAGMPPASSFVISLFMPVLKLLAASVWINVMLAAFNCLPIPPLDGSKVLISLLPANAARSYAGMELYGFVLLLVLFQLGIVNRAIMPIIHFASGCLLR